MSADRTDSKVVFHHLRQGAAAPSGRHVTLVPGEDVPLLSLSLPKGLRGQAREQVARRQLRDAAGLGQDKVEIRPFVQPGQADSWSRALVADTGLVAGWRKAAPAACRAVLPDYLSLPASPDIWCVQAQNGAILVRLGPEDGFSADADLARAMLARALDSGPAPKALLRCGAPLADIETLMQARKVPVIDKPAAAKALGLESPAILGHGELGLDLRSDPQAARTRLRRQVLPWRLPVLLGLAAAGLWAATQIIATRGLDRAIADERAATMAVVRDHFVAAGPVLDVRSQVAQALAARRAEAALWQGRISPLTLFGQAAEVIAAQEAAPEQISYSEADGLVAVLRVADFAAVDRLVGALMSAGLEVQVLGSRVSEGVDGVRTELRLRAGATQTAGGTDE